MTDHFEEYRKEFEILVREKLKLPTFRFGGGYLDKGTDNAFTLFLAGKVTEKRLRNLMNQHSYVRQIPMVILLPIGLFQKHGMSRQRLITQGRC